MNESVTRTFPEFSLARLLKTVFEPKPGQRIGILIDLADPRQIEGFAFLKDPALTIQRHAHDVFYQGLKNGVLAELGLVGGELFAYQITGGSNLDLPDVAWTPEGRQVSLARDVYPHFDILLCISTYSATAPLTAFAKQFGFRGATLHGVNPIMRSARCFCDCRSLRIDRCDALLSSSRTNRNKVASRASIIPHTTTAASCEASRVPFFSDPEFGSDSFFLDRIPLAICTTGGRRSP